MTVLKFTEIKNLWEELAICHGQLGKLIEENDIKNILRIHYKYYNLITYLADQIEDNNPARISRPSE